MGAKSAAHLLLEGFYGEDGAKRFISAQNDMAYYDDALRKRLPAWAYRRLHLWAKWRLLPTMSNETYVIETESVARMFRKELEKRFSEKEVREIVEKINAAKAVDEKLRKNHPK